MNRIYNNIQIHTCAFVFYRVDRIVVDVVACCFLLQSFEPSKASLLLLLCLSGLSLPSCSLLVFVPIGQKANKHTGHTKVLSARRKEIKLKEKEKFANLLRRTERTERMNACVNCFVYVWPAFNSSPTDDTELTRAEPSVRLFCARRLPCLCSLPLSVCL